MVEPAAVWDGGGCGTSSALYDPTRLRVTVSVPQSAALGLQKDAAVRIQLLGLPAGREWVTPSRTVVLPTVDPGTHSVQLRLELPSQAPGTAGDAATTVLAPEILTGVSAGMRVAVDPQAAVSMR